ncbi:hydrolase [Pseudoalteromonas piscicida]|uniref:Hydrolase n=1 Tax=Pseudoalteromonas piscicida TaxID=43662 RepID=A0AAQ2EV16_PSEO7|nr:MULTISPECIES: alkaline phosphatase family protein [Pseudoalteromonas]KJY91829.1 hydrolase [Pseudoalteromonas piscicida]TMN37400.1 hydrolase [Pseudoalteromonas piscicida]TMN45242.1 hydrolase [Pseudoalteromonas piscicida]TMN52054.1 hydrolase [Pseudoalteromonas piscicida]TMN54202.1 hydrolase [Pseudoalteromonas piscicida]
MQASFGAPKVGRWYLFITESWKILLLWLGGVFLLMSFRLFYLFHFSENISLNITVKQILDALATGFKFDSSAAGVCLAIPFLLNCFLQPLRLDNWVRRARNMIGLIYLSVFVLLGICGITYISEYGTQYNYLMLEGLYDDQQAILSTVIQQYKPWGSLLSIGILLSCVVVWTRFVDKRSYRLLINICPKSRIKQAVISILVFVMFVCAARGSFDSRPASRKWSAVTTDPFVNNLVINPFRSFFYAIQDYGELNQLTTSSTNPYLADKHEVDDALLNNETRSMGPLIQKPSRIFYIVMESFDSWPLQDKYRDLALTENFHRLKAKGIYVEQALPAASSTMNSLSSLVTGIPFSGINMSSLTSKAHTYSLIHLMEGQGYTSQFFYGGLLSWQTVGDFMSRHGVDHIYSAANAGGKGSAGVWGVDDGQLFDLVSQSVPENSFNLIMTTSYHGPFNLDLSASDYPWKNGDYPAQFQLMGDEVLSANTLGHLWYSDQMMGQFVDNMQRKYPDALFIITGDHYSRRYFHAKPNLYELTHVPILLLGQGVSPKLSNRTIASHMDITATIMDLIARPNTSFSSFGHSLVGSEAPENVFGYKTIRDTERVWKQGDGEQFYSYQVNPKLGAQNVEQQVPILEYQTYMAAAWQLLMGSPTPH